MIVYHGSKSLFNQFSYDKIGTNATSEGKGFYFTDNKQIATGYAENGYLYTVNIQSKKPLSHDTKKITKTQFKKYLIAINKVTDYLSNWGDTEFEGYENVLSKAINAEYDYVDNDVDMICSICNSTGSIETCLKILHDMFGYDSIVMDAEWGEQKLYIALVNDIIRIVNVEQIRQTQ